MDQKAKYYAIFGLPIHASKQEVRKAYRKIAKELHPDKNPDPKAHQLFLQLTEAYERILKDDFTKTTSTTRKNKSPEERKKEAAIRFQKQQIREQKEHDHYYYRLTHGKRWKIYKSYSIFAACIAILLFIEPMLPSHHELHTITDYSPRYNGLIEGQVVSYKTDKGLELFVNKPSPSLQNSMPRIVVERSWIFHNPIQVHQFHGSQFYSYDTDFSVVSLFPGVPLLFCIPFLTYYFRRKNHWFTLMYLFSFYLIGTYFFYVIFTQERWFHLLSLGFL